MELSTTEIQAYKKVRRETVPTIILWLSIPLGFLWTFSGVHNPQIPASLLVVIGAMSILFRPKTSQEQALALLDRYVQADPEALKLIAEHNKNTR